MTLEELDAHARMHVAGYKVPRELHVVDKIERSPSGKPDYPWAKRHRHRRRRQRPTDQLRRYLSSTMIS